MLKKYNIGVHKKKTKTEIFYSPVEGSCKTVNCKANNCEHRMMPFEIRFGRLVKRSMKNKLGEGGQGEVYEGFFHKMNKAPCTQGY